MAAPTPVTKTFWDGTRGMVRWYAAWSNGDQQADAKLVDISTLAPAPTSVKIRTIDIFINGNLQVDFEYDATTDELIDRFIGQSDITVPFFRDYSEGPNNGYVPDKTATGFGGDILLTTVGAASGDEVSILCIFQTS